MNLALWIITRLLAAGFTVCSLGTAAATLRRKCTLQRCQVAPANTYDKALRSTSWASEMTSCTPLSPRRERLRQNSNQDASVSQAPTARPSTLFSPLSRTPTATTAAWLTIAKPGADRR